MKKLATCTRSLGGARLVLLLLFALFACIASAQVNTWTLRAHMLKARCRFGAATGPDGRIYVFGGQDTIGQFETDYKSAEVYDPSTDTWSAIADMPDVALDTCAAKSADGRIFIVGVGKAYIYDTTTNSYTTIAAMTGKAQQYVALGNDGNMYGMIASTGGNPLYVYDPVNDVWNIRSKTAPDINYLAGVTTGPDGLIYIVGGLDASNTSCTTVNIYNANADVWTKGPDMFETHSDNSNAFGGDGRLYTVGGFQISIGADTEALDLGAGTWSIVPHTVVQRYYASSAETPDGRIFVMGGLDGYAIDSVESFQPPVLSASGANFSVQEGTAFNGTVATIKDAMTNQSAGDFTATIDWGDGSQSTGVISAGVNPGDFNVAGQHTYAEAGKFPISIQIDDNDNESVKADGKATVTDAPLHSAASSIGGFANVSFNGKVGSFTDDNSSAGTGDFTATISWGDGSTSSGTVSSNGSGFDVKGSHTYTSAGSFTTSITVNDAEGSSTSAGGSANIQVAPPQVTAGSINATEGASFSGVVGSFTDLDPTLVASNFTVTINWGDGTTTNGSVATNGSGGFNVSGTHTYAEEGSYVLTISATAPGSTTSSAAGSATVADAPLIGTGYSILGKYRSFSGVVATFKDTDPGGVVGDYTATILWGDGGSSVGTIKSASGSFSVSGSHNYLKKLKFTVQVLVTDVGGATSTITTTIDMTKAR